VATSATIAPRRLECSASNQVLRFSVSPRSCRACRKSRPESHCPKTRWMPERRNCSSLSSKSSRRWRQYSRTRSLDDGVETLHVRHSTLQMPNLTCNAPTPFAVACRAEEFVSLVVA
jgi:hypothetical protein